MLDMTWYGWYIRHDSVAYRRGIPSEPITNCGKNVVLKPDKYQHAPMLAQRFVVHLAGDLRPPIINPRHKPDERPAEHHIMEVGHHKIRVMQLHVHGQSRQGTRRSARRS